MSQTDDKEKVQLNVYARPFIPQSLRDVNEVPANIIACTPTRTINYSAYVSTFAGSDHLTANLDTSPQKPATQSRSESSDEEPDLENLSADNYDEFFRNALAQERDALWLECEDHALFRVPILISADRRQSMYRTDLVVPGLREMSLRIEVGDVVQLRQLRFNDRGAVISGSLIKDSKGRPIKTGRPVDNQHNAVVWNIDRLRETLSLRIDSLTSRSMLFNVRFTVQSTRLVATYRAVISAQQSLHTSSQPWMRSMLFPDNSDGYLQKTLNRANISLGLYDPLLNYEQQRAVSTVLEERYGTVPYLISGPPGTGKTKTIVELALQMILANPQSHLLLCAPSDPAADTLLQRLSEHLDPPQILRLNAPSRSFPEVSNRVLPYCFVDDGLFSIPPFRELMQKQVVVTTCRDAEILVRARLCNKDIFQLEKTLADVLHPETAAVPKMHWTGLLIDEAAQATETEALITVSVISPPDNVEIPVNNLPSFVLAGDQNQLGPRTASKTIAMQMSLFERLLDRPFYRDHPLARSRQSGGVMRPLTQDMLPIVRPAFTNLIRNYRSHAAILAVPSSLFYSDTLEPEATDTGLLQSLPFWQNYKWPVVFACNKGLDEIETDGGGWYNYDEAHKACRYAYSFIQSGALQPEEICIMSPFRAQVRVLRKFAREQYSMSGVNIGPLEAFQGLESTLVIICTTRARDRFIDQDIARGLGVIHEPRRFNVAITRAKKGLIVIGNPHLLVQDDSWLAFMSFCHRNGLWEDNVNAAWSPKESVKQGVSRLERQLLQADRFVTEGEEESYDINGHLRRLGVADDDETELWRSGVEMERAMLSEEE